MKPVGGWRRGLPWGVGVCRGVEAIRKNIQVVGGVVHAEEILPVTMEITQPLERSTLRRIHYSLFSKTCMAKKKRKEIKERKIEIQSLRGAKAGAVISV